MSKAIFVGATALVFSVCAWAQPPSSAPAGAPAAQSVPSAFGMKRGQPIDRLKLSPAPDGPGWHKLEGKIPQPHPEFEVLRLFAAPKVGLCAIRALGPAFSNDSYGATLRERFSRVEAQLTQKYGAGEKFDECDSKTSSCAAGYWSMHIKTGARTYGTFWEGGSKLPPGVKSIDLFAQANEISDPFIAVQYVFDNEEQCKAALDSEQSTAL